MRYPVRRLLLPLSSILSFLVVALAASAQSVPPELYNGLNWRMIGPFRGGRSVAVTGVPGDNNTFYFGSVGGGVWKTNDAGITWQPVFDNQPIASIGAIAVAPSDGQVIYVGTGESDIRGDLSSGDGVYKSADGGQTWKNIGLRDSRQISRIVVDPQNPNLVYVGVFGHAYGPNPERGVYKSTDGGNTWTHSLDRGPDIGISDLAIATSQPNILFAGTWNAHRPPWSTYAPLPGPGSGLYRSTDAGATWSQLTGNGLPDGDWGRVGVAVSPDGNRVYSLIDAGKKSGLYRSDDGGITWTLANGDPRLTSRAWYFNWITVDPSHPDEIYIPNVALYRSEDGGKTISVLRGAPGGDDYHQLWVDPKNSTHLILGTDQGTTISLNHGQTWSSWYNQPTAQFYHIVTDNEFPYHVYGAQQDSGSAAIASRTDHGQITSRDWFMVGGGESAYLAVDPTNPNILYSTGVYGTVSRWDRRTSFSQDISPWPMPLFGTEINQRKYRAAWTPMLVFSPTEKNALYLGTQYVMKTTDGGLHWKQISPDLTGAVADASASKATEPLTADNAQPRGFGVVYAIAPSPLKADQIWAGSDTGLIHLTRDGGKSWQNVTPPGLSPWSKIAMIEASRFDPAEAYVAVDRHRLEDQKPYLYRTRDFGKTWQSITDGIGASSFANAIRHDDQKRGLLFAGTELGVYVSFDDGDHWQPLQLNLPTASVRDLAIHGDDLVIATHGRSFWVLDNITPLRQLDLQSPPAGDVHLYKPATAMRIDNDVFLGSPLSPEEPTAKNPPEGAVIDYYLKSNANNVTLEIVDPTGKPVRRFRSGAPPTDEKRPPLPIAERWIPKPAALQTSPGMHRFVWDMRWGSSGTREELEDEGYGAPRGPRIAPGNYQLKLQVDDAAFTQPLKVVMDPRSSATIAALQEQQRLALEVFSHARAARRVVMQINAVNKKLDEYKQQAGKNPELLAQITSVQTAITALMKGPGGPPGSITGLEAAANAVAAALRVVESGDRTPPSQAVEIYHQADAVATAKIDQWMKLKSGDLANLNQSLQAAGMAFIQLSQLERQAELAISQ